MSEVVEKRPKSKTEVTILDRREITTYPKLKQAFVQYAVTYVSGPNPPRTIFVPKEGFSQDVMSAAIKKDMDELAKFEPETIEV